MDTGIFPVGSKIEMRLVHIFEMRDGKISREIVFDMGPHCVIDTDVPSRVSKKKTPIT
jgi:hypothetical protein